jgi:hypothetical protein
MNCGALYTQAMCATNTKCQWAGSWCADPSMTPQIGICASLWNTDLCATNKACQWMDGLGFCADSGSGHSTKKGGSAAPPVPTVNIGSTSTSSAHGQGGAAAALNPMAGLTCGALWTQQMCKTNPACQWRGTWCANPAWS